MLANPTLDRLLADDPEGLARMRALVPTGRVGTVDTPHGPVVATGGRKLHSGRDPLTEATRFARELELAEVGIVVLFGFGSGHVARAIAARTDAPIVVFEPDLEALAVGVTHGDVAPSTRVITTPERLSEYLYARLGTACRGVLAKWTPSIRVAPSLYGAAHNAAAQAIDRAGLRQRTARIRGPGWLRHYIANLPALAIDPGLPALAGKLAGVPAIIVAAGPSLDRNLETLRTLTGSAFVIAVNTAATALGRAGIVPSAVVAIESLDVSSQLAALPFISDIPAFLELTGHPSLWKLPFLRKIPISVDTNACAVFSAKIDPKHQLSAGFCVANAAVAIAHALGCSPIVLVGSDLAYSGDRVYASGTAFADMRAEVGESGTAKLTGLHGKRAIEGASLAANGGVHMPDVAKTLRAPGWGGGPDVVTTRDFTMFRDWYASAAKHLRGEGKRPINATEGGLHIPGWDDVPLADALPRVDVTKRIDAMLAAKTDASESLAAHIDTEREAALELVTLAFAAHRQIADDPDGDLALDEAGARALHEINARTRALLNTSPLCSEAVFVPIEDLRIRGAVTTWAFYRALIDPLTELAAALARASQYIQSNRRAA